METKEKTTRRLRPLLPLLPPVLLSLLFYLFRGRQALMDGWVIHVMAPAEQLLGRLSAPLPFSLAEVLVTVFLTACALCLIRGTVLAVRLHAPHELGRRLVCLLCALLWVWTGYCWLWSAGYYSASFAEKSGLETRPYTVSTLAQVTLYFACQAADLSTQMVRDSEGHFAEDLDDCFRRGVSVYEELEQKLPCLAMPSVPCKPMFFSRLQSMMGFTGVYFPFTGEANVNVDAPACLIPSTIAHELSHQRGIASEQECNFLAVLASTTSGDPVYEYSGWLMGYIHLGNALYQADPAAWQAIRDSLPDTVLADLASNNAYWASFEGAAADASQKVYDTILKGYGQEDGIRSYGTVVDLLVAYYRDTARTNGSEGLTT